MKEGQKLCFRIEVPTTNPAKDTFSIEGEYFDCKSGHVFVMAETIAEAASLIPCAESIDLIGFGFVPNADKS